MWDISKLVKNMGNCCAFQESFGGMMPFVFFLFHLPAPLKQTFSHTNRTKDKYLTTEINNVCKAGKFW